MKRLLIHMCGFNLWLLMRQLIGVGTPRGLHGRLSAVMAARLALIGSLRALANRHGRSMRQVVPIKHRSLARFAVVCISV